MRVYRVALNEGSKGGPFVNPRAWGSDGRMSDRHPPVYWGEVPFHITGCRNEQDVCFGVACMQDFLQWWAGYETKLAEAGYQVYEYEVPTAYVWVSREQAVFPVKVRKLVAVHPILSFIEQAYNEVLNEALSLPAPGCVPVDCCRL